MSRISTPFKPELYTSFAGLNTSRDAISMERPEAQPFVEMNNLYCTSTGYLTNENPLKKIDGEDSGVSHIRYFSSENGVAVYAAKSAKGVSLRTLGKPSIKQEDAFKKDAVVTSTLFNGKVILAAGDESMYQFDGYGYKKIFSPSVKGARYVTQIQDRLAVAGFDNDPNEIILSRVNKENVYPKDETVGSTDVLKAARFNVQNLIGNGDRIRGISSFENNKFAVFTNDRVLVYLADQDFGNWSLDTRLVVRYGTISHNSIVSVGDEVFFCSRAGVHSIRRSALNGSTVFTNPLSDDIQELYQRLLAQVPNKEMISAYFNPDEGRIHIFFPVNGLLSYRLSGSLAPAKQEGDITKIKWSLSSFAGLTCGDYIAGRNTCGSISGLHSIGPWYSDDGIRGEGYAVTPYLWHKDLFQPKQSIMLVVYASGQGTIYVDAENEQGRKFSTLEFQLPGKDQADYHGVPLQEQFTRPFAQEYKGIKLRIRFGQGKMIRVFGLGLLVKE